MPHPTPARCALLGDAPRPRTAGGGGGGGPPPGRARRAPPPPPPPHTHTHTHTPSARAHARAHTHTCPARATCGTPVWRGPRELSRNSTVYSAPASRRTAGCARRWPGDTRGGGRGWCRGRQSPGGGGRGREGRDGLLDDDARQPEAAQGAQHVDPPRRTPGAPARARSAHGPGPAPKRLRARVSAWPWAGVSAGEAAARVRRPCCLVGAHVRPARRKSGASSSCSSGSRTNARRTRRAGSTASSRSTCVTPRNDARAACGRAAWVAPGVRSIISCSLHARMGRGGHRHWQCNEHAAHSTGTNGGRVCMLLVFSFFNICLYCIVSIVRLATGRR